MIRWCKQPWHYQFTHVRSFKFFDRGWQCAPNGLKDFSAYALLFGSNGKALIIFFDLNLFESVQTLLDISPFKSVFIME